MPLRFNTAILVGRLSAINTTFNAGTPPATIEVRTGAGPTNLTDADSGTHLATGTFGNPAFVTPTTGTMQENAITGGTAAASGTPGHFRVKQGGTGTVICQGTAGVGSGDLSFSATIALGGAVTFTDFSITDPNQ